MIFEQIPYDLREPPDDDGLFEAILAEIRGKINVEDIPSQLKTKEAFREWAETIGIREDWYQPSKPFRRIFFRLFPNFTRDMRYIQFLVIAEPT